MTAAKRTQSLAHLVQASRPGMGLNREIQAIRWATKVLKEGMETSNESEIGEQRQKGKLPEKIKRLDEQQNGGNERLMQEV